MPHDVLPPHSDLTAYYTDARAKPAFLRSIFDDTAADYDRIENVLALGYGGRYRREALARAGLGSGMAALDVAMGTGLVAREALALTGPTGSVVGLDPSVGMVAQAHDLPLPVVLGRGEYLPFDSAAFDFLSMGYALRHLGDLHRAFAEFFRVLRPGGRVCILEIARPEGVVRRKLMEAYFRGVLPIISRAVGTRPQSQKLWAYYWETIDQCVSAKTVLDTLEQHGFSSVKRNVELGFFAEYTGEKPGSSAA